MGTLLILGAIAFLVTYVVYTTYFGELKGDHVNGINAMVYVQHDLDRQASIKAARDAHFEGMSNNPPLSLPVAVIMVKENA